LDFNFNTPAADNNKQLAPPPGRQAVDLELPVDGQRSLAELIDMYEANMGAPRRLSGIDDTAAPGGVQVSGTFLTPWLFGGATATNGVMQQQQQQQQQQQSAGFYVRDDALPFGGDIAAASPELRFSSGLNVPGSTAHYGGASQLQQPHKPAGSNWFY